MLCFILLSKIVTLDQNQVCSVFLLIFLRSFGINSCQPPPLDPKQLDGALSSLINSKLF